MNDETKEILPDITNIKSQETYTLPSRGLVYTESDNIPASVTLRRMTTREEKIRLRNQGEDKIRRDLLQACIIENIDASKLKLEDANYLIFNLRVLSLLDDTYKVFCKCPKCGVEFVHQINLSEIPVKFFNQEDLNKFKLQLPICKSILDLKLPSIADIILMGDRIREYLDQFPNADKGELLYIYSSILYMDKVNGNMLLSEELDEYINNLDIIDARALKDRIYEIDNLYGYQDNIKTQCPSCKFELSHGLPITGELFNPSK